MKSCSTQLVEHRQNSQANFNETLTSWHNDIFDISSEKLRLKTLIKLRTASIQNLQVLIQKVQFCRQDRI